MKAAKLAIEAGINITPYSPYKINYMEAPHMNIANEPPAELSQNPFLTTPAQINEIPEQEGVKTTPVETNPNDGYITFKTFPFIIK